MENFRNENIGVLETEVLAGFFKGFKQGMEDPEGLGFDPNPGGGFNPGVPFMDGLYDGRELGQQNPKRLPMTVLLVEVLRTIENCRMVY